MLDLTDALGDPVVGALSLADAEARLAEGLRTLPELARVLENPITAGAVLGASDGTSPGVWFLELDHDELDGTSDRPAFGGLDVFAADGGDGDGPVGLAPFGAAEPLSEVLGPLNLDPLTVVDDETYTDRLAGVPDLSPEAVEVIRGLARLYRRKPPDVRGAGGARGARRPHGSRRAGGTDRPARAARRGGGRHRPGRAAGRLPSQRG